MEKQSSSMRILGRKLSHLNIAKSECARARRAVKAKRARRAKMIEMDGEEEYLERVRKVRELMEQIAPSTISVAPTKIDPVSDDEKIFIEHPSNINNILIFDCPFAVTNLIPDAYGNKVTRIEATGECHLPDTYLKLDLNTETYPLSIGDKFRLILTPIPNPNGNPHTGYYWTGSKLFRNDFEYEMSGIVSKIYVVDPPGIGKYNPFAEFQVWIEAYFGTLSEEGLLMKIINYPAGRLWEGQSLSLLLKKT